MNKKTTTIKKSIITVAGDVTVDWLEVNIAASHSNSKDNNSDECWRNYKSTRFEVKPGGAMLLAKFIEEATGAKIIAPDCSGLRLISASKMIRAYSRLGLFSQSAKSKQKVYRVEAHNGFEGPSEGAVLPQAVKGDDPKASVVVINDLGNGFCNEEKVWPKALTKGKPEVIYKVSCQMHSNKLLNHLQKMHADRYVIVVDIDKLRLKGLNVSRRLSWEKTASELAWQLEHHPIKSTRAIIVRFGVEGALLYEPKTHKSTLFYDPKLGEDGYSSIMSGKMPGTANAFVAGIVDCYSSSESVSLARGIKTGLIYSRRLIQEGFGPDAFSINYPLNKVFHIVKSDLADINSVQVPDKQKAREADKEYWSIIQDINTSGLESSAINYLRTGSDYLFKQAPVGQFGAMMTIDRSEIESFRAIRNLMLEYLHNPNVGRPLSIAVFGAPGSGKSFGVAQVAKSVAPGRVQKIEFNISQFNSRSDLSVALHKVRDITLGGQIPLVFFDEFDAALDGEVLGWLKYFLAPMQDGAFRDGETMHPIGRAIFVFAGGTSSSFSEFICRNGEEGQGKLKEREEKFRLAKGPDFASRLRGFINIKGVNPVDEEDKTFAIRRAMLLRVLVKSTNRHLFQDKILQIDDGVIRAFLRTNKFEHGIRSLQAIIEMSQLADRKKFEASALPSKAQLALHVDADEFMDHILQSEVLMSSAEEIAKVLQAIYCKDQKSKKPADDPAVQPWENLDEKFKESNRQQAKHIAVKLEAIGYDFAPIGRAKVKPILFKKNEIEELSIMEHDRWVEERLTDGWTSGERDPEHKVSPYLIPWDDLTEEVKGYDRTFMRSIPEIMIKAGFRIFKKKDK